MDKNQPTKILKYLFVPKNRYINLNIINIHYIEKRNENKHN